MALMDFTLMERRARAASARAGMLFAYGGEAYRVAAKEAARLDIDLIPARRGAAPRGPSPAV